MALNLEQIRQLRNQALERAEQAVKDRGPREPMDLARIRQLREQHQALQQSFEQAVQAGEASEECEPGDVLATYRRKSKADTWSFLHKWLLDRSPDVTLGYAGLVLLLRVLTCATKPEAARYIGRKKLARRARVTVGTIRDHIRTLTHPWRLEDGPWQPPLFRRVSEGWGPRRVTYWIGLQAGWNAFVRTLDAHAKGQKEPGEEASVSFEHKGDIPPVNRASRGGNIPRDRRKREKEQKEQRSLSTKLTLLRARTERAPQAKHFMLDSAAGEWRIEQ